MLAAINNYIVKVSVQFFENLGKTNNIGSNSDTCNNFFDSILKAK